MPQSATANRPTDAARGIGPRIADPTIVVRDARELVDSIMNPIGALVDSIIPIGGN